LSTEGKDIVSGKDASLKACVSSNTRIGQVLGNLEALGRLVLDPDLKKEILELQIKVLDLADKVCK